MMDSYLAPVWEKELAFEESGDLIFATPPKKTPAKPTAPVILSVIDERDSQGYIYAPSPKDVIEISRKLNRIAAGLLGGYDE